MFPCQVLNTSSPIMVRAAFALFCLDLLFCYISPSRAIPMAQMLSLPGQKIALQKRKKRGERLQLSADRLGFAKTAQFTKELR